MASHDGSYPMGTSKENLSGTRLIGYGDIDDRISDKLNIGETKGIVYEIN